MEEPCDLHRRSIAYSGKEIDETNSNHCSRVKNSPSVKDALKKEMKHKIEGDASPRSPMILRKKLSIALSAGRYSNVSNEKTEKDDNSCYSPHNDSGYIQEFGVSYGRNVTNAVKENDSRKTNVWVKHIMKRKMVGNASPRSPMILRKKPSIAMSPSRFRNSSNGKREKGNNNECSDIVVTNMLKENEMRRSNIWVKHDMKRKMVGNASPRSPMILRKKPAIAMSPSRFRNSSNGKREKGCSQPMQDSVLYERIPKFAGEKDMKKSIHQSHIKNSPSTKDIWVKDKMKLQTEENANQRASMILRKMRSITIASRFRNLFIQRKENGDDSCRGIFPSVGSSPYGDFGMNYTGKSMCLRCSNLTRKSNDSHHRLCHCSTEVVDELAASFEDSKRHQKACSSETRESDDSYDLCVECKQPGSLVYCAGKGCRIGYHSSCSDPTLKDNQHGTWLCFCCLQKKMEFGACSISRGIESILDSTDDAEGERHYFVKFKGLAHIHNSWISRSRLLIEDPVRLAKFDEKWQRGQVVIP